MLVILFVITTVPLLYSNPIEKQNQFYNRTCIMISAEDSTFTYQYPIELGGDQKLSSSLECQCFIMEQCKDFDLKQIQYKGTHTVRKPTPKSENETLVNTLNKGVASYLKETNSLNISNITRESNVSTANVLIHSDFYISAENNVQEHSSICGMGATSPCR